MSINLRLLRIIIREKIFKTELFPRNQAIFTLYNSIYRFKNQTHSTQAWALLELGPWGHAYPPRLFHYYLISRQHILTGNDLWQLINSSEYKPLSKEVLTNLHFSSSHISNFLIILTREMFKENSTNSSEIYGQCFPNKCTNIHQTAISFQQYEFPFTPPGAPATLGTRTPGPSPTIRSAPTYDPLLRKEKALYCMPKHMPAYRGLIFKGLSKKASKRCQTAGDAVGSDL